MAFRDDSLRYEAAYRFTISGTIFSKMGTWYSVTTRRDRPTLQRPIQLRGIHIKGSLPGIWYPGPTMSNLALL
jgi:hypothetical protein